MFTARYVLHSTFCAHSVFMCFVWIWDQTAIISLYSIDWLVFITETECVYCAVRTEYLTKTLMRKRKYTGQAQPLFITVKVIIDVQLKCYPRAAVTITVRQGRMKQGSSFRAIIAIRRSVAASRAATGCREVNATAAWKELLTCTGFWRRQRFL